MRTMLFVLALVFAAHLGAQQQTPVVFTRPPTCVYMMIRGDSLLIAATPPPCDPRRPQTDTVRFWRLESRVKNCVGRLILETTAAAVIGWFDCEDGPVLRRVIVPYPGVF